MSEIDNAKLESLIKDVVKSLVQESDTGSKKEEQGVTLTAPDNKGKGVKVSDYPLGKKQPDLIKTPTGKSLNEISLQNLMEDKIEAEDTRITADTLYLQAQIAEEMNRPQFAENLRRAAELTAIPDDKVLDIYNALRPYRSSKEDLMAIADELESRYQAKINAAMVRQAAMVYEKRNRLKR